MTVGVTRRARAAGGETRVTCHLISLLTIMAPKRRVVDDEDEEVKHAEASPPATKRARTSVKGEGSSTQAHHAKPEDDDDDENFDVGDAVTPPTQNIDDEDFEAQMQAKIRASIEKRHNHTAVCVASIRRVHCLTYALRA